MLEPESSFTLKGGVFALGNFDGVHRGHQAVIKATLEKARSLGAPARIFTLEPHPRSVLKPDIPPFRLTPATAKIRLLRSLGIDDVIVQNFSPEFAQMSATDFLQQILIDKLGAQHIVAGFDYVFGHNRAGNMQTLRSGLSGNGVNVTEVTPLRDRQGDVMSSSRTRECLRRGDVQTAANILGRAWSIAGIVEHGSQHGRQMGVPTANLSLGDYLRPKFGVYAARAARLGQALTRTGIVNIGTRPTVDGKTEMLELHLFDFNEDIYGQEWEVALIDFIRPEQAFDGLDALRTQIVKDMGVARAKLAAST